MANIYEVLVNALNPLGYTIREQGSFRSDEILPETFITFFIIDSPNNTHYDNFPKSTTYKIQVTLYSKKPNIIQNADFNIKTLMIGAGFIRVNARSLPFSPDTLHYAWTQDYKFKMEE